MRHSRSLSSKYFETLYQEDSDPWGFATSPYEQEKYAETIRALEPRQYTRALEVGCSIGVLTEMLASQCDWLVATDVSATALDQARRRCAAHHNVDFQLVESAAQNVRGPFDLVVLSEVLYYWDEQDLGAFAEEMTRELTVGATVLLVHWRGPTDYPMSADDAVARFGRLLQHDYVIRRQMVTEAYRLEVWDWKGRP